MSDDWKPGDEALCIRGGERTRKGAVYTVDDITPPRSFDGEGGVNNFDVPTLRFSQLRPYERLAWSVSSRFIKVTPKAPDSEDAEVIALLNGAGVKEPVT